MAFAHDVQTRRDFEHRQALRHTITLRIAARLAVDDYNVPTYDALTDVEAFVRWQRQQIVNHQGQDATSIGFARLLSVPRIEVSDYLEIEPGIQLIILRVERRGDASLGNQTQEVYF